MAARRGETLGLRQRLDAQRNSPAPRSGDTPGLGINRTPSISIELSAKRSPPCSRDRQANRPTPAMPSHSASPATAEDRRGRPAAATCPCALPVAEAPKIGRVEYRGRSRLFGMGLERTDDRLGHARRAQSPGAHKRFGEQSIKPMRRWSVGLDVSCQHGITVNLAPGARSRVAGAFRGLRVFRYATVAASRANYSNNR